MKNKITTVIVFFISASCFSQGIAPSVVNISGGNSQKGYYQFEWSVGEMSLITEMTSQANSLVVTNGFLQPYLLNPGTNNTNNQFGSDEIRVFPNPASSHVEIDLFTRQRGRLKMSFYNAIGQKVQTIESNVYGVDFIQKLPVNNLAAGTYLLHIELAADPNYLSKNGVYKITKVE